MLTSRGRASPLQHGVSTEVLAHRQGITAAWPWGVRAEGWSWLSGLVDVLCRLLEDSNHEALSTAKWC